MRCTLPIAAALAILTLARAAHAADLASQLVVGLARPGAVASAQPARLAARLARLGVTHTRTLAEGMPAARKARTPANPFEIDPERVWLLEAADSATAAAAESVLTRDPEIAWVEPNRVREVALAAPAGGLPPGFPDDPLFRDTRQWGLRNAGPAGAYAGIAGADIRALAAWSACTGSSALRDRDQRMRAESHNEDPDTESTERDALGMLLPGNQILVRKFVRRTSERAPNLALICAMDCQMVTSWTPMPARVDAQTGRSSRRMLPASSMSRRISGLTGLPQRLCWLT